MATYVLSEEADLKLAEIYRYSRRKFGKAQAHKYYEAMHAAFDRLAFNPMMGRAHHHLRRHPQGSHVIFYRPTENGVLIVDILHMSEDAGKLLS